MARAGDNVIPVGDSLSHGSGGDALMQSLLFLAAILALCTECSNKKTVVSIFGHDGPMRI